MVNSRRSNELRSQDLERLKRLLDLGISPKGVRAYAQSTFNVSRQQAHRDTVKAMADRSKDKRVKPIIINQIESKKIEYNIISIDITI